jgi:hypothetical protein
MTEPEAEAVEPQGAADAAMLTQWFEASEEATYDARALAERDRDYYDGRQLTSEEETELKRRGQPPVVINRIQRKIDFLTGIEKQSRTDPRALARTPQHEDSAEAVTDSIRFVLDNNRADKMFSMAWANLLIEGACGVDVGVMQKRDGTVEIELKAIRWDRMFFDPHSAEPDFSDARYLGTVRWLDYEDAVDMFPDGAGVLESVLDTTTGDTYDDRPKWNMWADKARKRVRICEIWYLDDVQWYWANFTKGGILAEGESPFVDENGDSQCGLIFQSAYVNRDNERYGVVRSMISPQDEVNKRRSKLLHMLTMRQIRVSQAAEAQNGDIKSIQSMMARPDGVILGEQGDIERLDNNDQIAGHFNLLQHATNEIDLMGPNAAMSGKADRDQSGRAILAQQQGGMVELATMLDRLTDLKMRVYRAVWHRIKQFWTEERWVRVTDDEKNTKFLGINRQMTLADKLSGMEPEERAQAMQQMQLQPGDPRLGMVVEVENELEQLDVDIILEEVPDVATIQTEQFAEIVKLVQAGVPIPPDILIEMSQLRNKAAILEKMRGGGEQSPEQQQAAQAQQQMEQRNVMADIAGKEAKAMRDAQEANKTQIEAARLAAGVGD